jgi:alpha-glucosidase (family GH31 glycosyl hydrolase)
MLFEFPGVDETEINLQAPLWSQFMFGNAILVVPVLEGEVTGVNVYFPRGSWYEVWSGLNYDGASRWKKIEALLYQIPSYIRGGTIVPTLVILKILKKKS